MKRELPESDFGCGDVFGYGSGFALGAAIGGFVGTSAFGLEDSNAVVALLVLAGHVGGSLRVADTVYRRQKEDMVSRVNKM